MFHTVNQVLRWYYENEITLCNASSIDLSRLKSQPQRPKRRAINFSRLELYATINYHLSKLSETFQFICKGYYLFAMSSKDIARELNDMQHTRSYSAKRVEEVYHKNLRRLEKRLTEVGMINNGRGTIS